MRWILTLVAVAVLLASGGCNLFRKRPWSGPRIAVPRSSVVQSAAPDVPIVGQRAFYRANSVASEETTLPPVALPPPMDAETAYSQGLILLKANSADCVDAFYQAAQASWIACNAPNQSVDTARAEELYQSSLSLLIETGQQFCRIDPACGLTIKTSHGILHVPVSHHNFLWTPAEFGRMVPVGDYHNPKLTSTHRRSGWGVPLVVERKRRPNDKYFGKRLSFAATAVLRPAHAASRPSSVGRRCQQLGSPNMVLELYDPKSTDSIQVGECRLPLAVDLTAPFAWMANSRNDDWRSGFLLPGSSGETAELIMLEPYQRGKIPIVFIHGLLSDPGTWLQMANEIEARPWYRDRFQIWAFRYPTGEPFLRSAAHFRSECRTLVAELSCNQADPLLSQIVLIGHSMGGLVAKLQVTESGTHLWTSFANRPIEHLRIDNQKRQKLRDMFFFSRQPFVRRVIFLGTPHGGSGWAQQSIGRVGSAMVDRSSEDKAAYRDLIDNNPNTFAEFAQHGIPTSVDLLEPSNPLLQAIRNLPIDSNVDVHSIIGTGRSTLAEGPGDGVVPVQSARIPSTGTEFFVPTVHTKLNQHPRSIEHVLGILKQHWETSSIGSRQSASRQKLPHWSSASSFRRTMSQNQGLN